MRFCPLVVTAATLSLPRDELQPSFTNAILQPFPLFFRPTFQYMIFPLGSSHCVICGAKTKLCCWMRYGSTGNISCMSNFEAWLLSTDAPDSKWNIDNLPQSHKWWKIFTKTLFWCFPKQIGMNFFSPDLYVKSLFYQINIGKYDTFVSIAYTVKYEFVYFQTNSFWPVKDPMSFSWRKNLLP